MDEPITIAEHLGIEPIEGQYHMPDFIPDNDIPDFDISEPITSPKHRCVSFPCLNGYYSIYVDTGQVALSWFDDDNEHGAIYQWINDPRGLEVVQYLS